MAIFTIEHHHYFHADAGVVTTLADIRRDLKSSLINEGIIMATIVEVEAKLDTIVAAQGVVATEVSEAAVVIGEIKAALDAAIASGATPAQLQALADRMDAVATGLTASAASLDAAATAADITL